MSKVLLAMAGRETGVLGRGAWPFLQLLALSLNQAVNYSF